MGYSVKEVCLGLVLVALCACQTAHQANEAPTNTQVVAQTSSISGETKEPVEPQAVATTVVSKGEKSEQHTEQLPPSAELVFLDFAAFDEDLSREMSESE